MIRIFERTAITEHSLSSVGTDSTGLEEELEITGSSDVGALCGILRGVSVACNSEDFDVSIRQGAQRLENSIHEFFRYEGANLKLEIDDLNVGWINSDTPKKGSLYMIVKNADASNATGVINARLTNDLNKRFSGNK